MGRIRRVTAILQGSAENLAILRRFALNLLRLQTSKTSMRGNVEN